MNPIDAYNITRPLGQPEMRECSNVCCHNPVKKAETWDNKQFCSWECEAEHDEDYR